MYQKRNTLLLFSLIGLTALSILVYIFLQPGKPADKDLFKVQNLAAVDRVLLNSKSSAIEVNFDGTRWKVNGRPADPNTVKVLMATLAQAEPKRPVAKSQRDSVAQYIRENGVLVTLMTGQTETLSFYASGNPQKTQAYFLRNGEDIPYAMVIPGYRVYVSGIFELDESGWLEKRIFNFNWRNFKSLTAEFPQSASDGYEVTYDGQTFSIAGMATDTAKLNTFLDHVSLMEADQFLEDAFLRDSLAKLLPEVTLRVSTVSGKMYQLSIFRKTGSAKVYGLTENSQVAVFARPKMEPVIRRKQWFELYR